jgi:16S rRNA (uracil1498-N3)-methyltransferase
MPAGEPAVTEPTKTEPAMTEPAMTEPDGRTPRLFVEAPLGAGHAVPLSREQAHYLLTVLRLGAEAAVLVFNGRDGEWLARLRPASRKAAELAAERQTRPQPAVPDLHYCFAPLKHARLDYVVQKAVEMGAAALRPVLTQHTQASRLNLERMQANAVEAAEQCGILSLPEIREPVRLDALLDGWEAGRRLVYCDEEAEASGPLAALQGIPPGPLAVLIGPEGGFSEAERQRLLRLPHVTRLSLGPRILRADTAAVAALALVQAVLGDWRT